VLKSTHEPAFFGDCVYVFDVVRSWTKSA